MVKHSGRAAPGRQPPVVSSKRMRAALMPLAGAVSGWLVATDALG